MSMTKNTMRPSAHQAVGLSANMCFLNLSKQWRHEMEFIVPLVLLIFGCIILTRRALAAHKDEVDKDIADKK
ncbi:hypothetical protein AB4160_16370 [Shewanella sp. 10N.286.51.B8]|uniref:hypothetical protein n=1 Tax=Shewanella sp. 10N.286.51.B8 TaxID=3229708 RepID=UPI00354AE3A2